ncbi:MAG TPA: hypothetical protein VK983_01445 [Candidatus Limnocylindrales bacterium]|nr:hypothetical protein [Candidatus Limnocylindrales bacterium]
MLAYAVIRQVLGSKPYLLRFVLIWFATVTVFIWLININLLAYILTSPVLGAAGKLSFIASAYANYFKYLNNPVALSSVIFSLLVALNFTLLIYLWREGKRKSKMVKSNAGAFVAMLGSHCISCGTSLVAPLITAVAGPSTYFSVERANAGILLATAANTLGIALVLWSIHKIVGRIRATRMAGEARI